MVPTLRRFLVLVALMFWLGGFTFYAGVVVPIGQRVLGRTAQSDVTRHVSIYLNLACAIALLPLAWDIAAADPSRKRRIARWACWINVVLTLAALHWLHGELVAILDHPSGSGQDAGFRFGHKAYLWISTYQWLAGVIYTVLMVQAWRAEDRLSGPGLEVGEPGA